MKSRAAVLNIICLFILIQMIHTQLGNQPMASTNNSISQHQRASSRYEYTFIESARGVTKEGVQASFQTYESSDGIRIFTRTEFFRSAADMETQFETKAKSFSEILQRRDIRDRKGNVKGERIVGKHFPDEKGGEKHSIIWNHDNKISYIESTSLNHVLDFEKKFYKSQK